MVYFHYKNIYTAHSFVLSAKPDVTVARSLNMQAVPLIGKHINVKTFA